MKIKPNDVEFIGLCGAGKTTLLNRLNRLPGADGLGARIHPSLRVPRVKFMCTAIGIFGRALFTHPSTTLPFLAHLSNYWLPFKLSYRLSERQEDPVPGWKIFADSGVLQPFVSFESEERVAKGKIPLKAFLQHLPLPEIIIFVNVSPETALDRYRRRGGKAVSRFDEKRLLEMFHSANAIIQDIIHECASTGVTIIEVQNSTDDDQSRAAETIYNALNQRRTQEDQ